ncbi:hypothetical protein M8C21_006026 [Ambrosia artemisiifolia]|uniref:Methyltransferase n=1 Tax=Ambrosia artemisiifolia TaxID=4212 RepID=A0AAD5C829_AMBAR|nr:hypothetical protein M8C21_006026 [Ambrosia artemisiifolia]
MSITVSNLLKQRRYPFIASLVLLLLFVTLFILTTNTSQPPPLYRLRQPSVTTTTPSPLTNVTNNIITNVDDSDDVSNGEGLELEWKVCPGPLAVDYIPCLDNWKVIKSLRSRRHMEHRERHCPKPKLRCLIPLPDGYKVPVRWPKSRDMVRLLVW